MKEADLLLTIAEVGAAFAGFASLVSILGRQRGSVLQFARSRRLRGMVLTALVVVLFAFAPFVFHHLGFSQAELWRISSGVFALAGVLLLANALIGSRRVQTAGFRESGVAERIRALTTLLLLPGAEVVLVVNTLGFGRSDPAALYLVGLLMYLLVAGLLFAGVLLPMLAGGGADEEDQA